MHDWVEICYSPSNVDRQHSAVIGSFTAVTHFQEKIPKPCEGMKKANKDITWRSLKGCYNIAHRHILFMISVLRSVISQ